MISGAPRSISLLSRLLRLITRRYRSLRSDVANRPPSSWTMGRSSGGMTATARGTFAGGPWPRRALLFLGEVDLVSQLGDGLGPHAPPQIGPVTVLHFPPQQLVFDDLAGV